MAIESLSRIEASSKVWVEWCPGSDTCVATVCADEEAEYPASVRVRAGVLVVGKSELAIHPGRLRVSSKVLESFACQGDAGGSAQHIDTDIFDARLEHGSRLLLIGTCDRRTALYLRRWSDGGGAMEVDQWIAHTVFAKATGLGSIEGHAEAIAEIIIDARGTIVVKGDPAVSKVERLGHRRAKVGRKVYELDKKVDGGIFDHFPISKP